MAKKTAFAALRIKDAAEAVAPIMRRTGMMVGALALLCLNTRVFMVLSMATLSVAAIYAVVRLVAFISGRTIRGLGFSEPGLERMALA